MAGMVIEGKKTTLGKGPSRSFKFISAAISASCHPFAMRRRAVAEPPDGPPHRMALGAGLLGGLLLGDMLF